MEQEVKKLSYEELEKAAQQLSVQVEQLQKRNNDLVEVLNQTNFANTLKRLEWLWLIITTKDSTLPKKFVDACIEEFMMIMTPNENTEE